MSYEKQTWNKYDDLKTEEENIVNGAVVTDNRMNHIEEGIYSHTIDISNPHKVTAAQVGLDKVDNIKQASKVEFDSHTNDTSNPHKVTATQLGLDKVDNIQQAAKIDFDSHVNNKANPHAVTASQVGAYSKQEIDTKLSNAIMADDSGKVIVKDLEVTNTLKRKEALKTFPIGYGITATAERIGEAITLSIYGANTAGAIPQGKVMDETIPDGFRPRAQYSCQVACQGQSYAFFVLGSDGKITYGGANVPISNNFRATVPYFTNDSFPAS